MNTDAETLNRSFDLLPIVQADVELKHSGGWFIGPCPFCGGEDRFNLHSTSDGWRWFCRGCGDGKYQDAASYLMRRESITFPDALKKMGGDKPDLREMGKRVAEIRQASEERKPNLTWMIRANDLVEECRQNLWKPAGEKALAYLVGRGFSTLTIHKYQVGYNPTERTEKLESWGLDGDGTVKIERGITIPCIGPDGVYAIKIRRPIPAGSKERKYIQVRGGRFGLFGWPDMRGAHLGVFTEGEFDCMTLAQCALDFASVCTLGSSTDSPMSISSDLLRWVYQTPHVLAVYDNDEAGRNGTAALQRNLPNVKIITLPGEYHDVNDAHLAGFDLADWLVREWERVK